MTLTTDPQTDYVAFWNDILAKKFERFRDILMNGLSHHSAVWLNGLHVAPGARIVDVGCGWGDTALALAHKAGPDGHVLGLDCVDQFLRKARADAKAEGRENVEFVGADVQTYPFDASFDLCFSRFGMMFFENPVAAMRNIRNALKPGAILFSSSGVICPRTPGSACQRPSCRISCPRPARMRGPAAPARSQWLRPRWCVSSSKSPGSKKFVLTPLTVGNSLRNAIDFQLAIGPAGEVFREAGALADARRAEIEAALRRALKPYQQADGRIEMPSASWRVSARQPA